MYEREVFWNDARASALELHAALVFWSRHHTQGSRERLRDAIKYYRRVGGCKYRDMIYDARND
jgi:hypothetical protein